ncbi:MAG: hypothetical protein IH623_09460, partial [Verrucomicrobia bacterium]|nr:hypothetical protein [Verrucomicrobiota bacterium]
LQFLARADQIEARKKELTTRREEIIAAKEKIFDAAGPEDAEAFGKIGELGAQENLVTVQLEKLDRERAGLGLALLNESNHLRKKVATLGANKRDRIVAKLDAALAKFIPNDRHRADIVQDASAVTPEIRTLKKRALSLGSYTFNPHTGDPVKFARQILRQAENAIEQCGL